MSNLNDDIKHGRPWHGARTPFGDIFASIDPCGALTSTCEERIQLWHAWLEKRTSHWAIFEGQPILRRSPSEGFFVVTSGHVFNWNPTGMENISDGPLEPRHCHFEGALEGWTLNDKAPYNPHLWRGVTWGLFPLKSSVLRSPSFVSFRLINYRKGPLTSRLTI